MSYLLQEDGDNILQEDGDALLLEDAVVVGSGQALSGIQGIDNLRIVEQANGGQVELSGRVTEGVVERYPDRFVKGGELFVKIYQTGAAWGWGLLKQPTISGGGLVELIAEGPAHLAETIVNQMFFKSDRLDDWNVQEARGVGKPPPKAPTATASGAGNVNVGVHRWKLANVYSDGVTKTGPYVELEVLSSAKQVVLKNFPKPPPNVTAVQIHRTDGGGSTYGLVDEVPAWTRSYTDNTVDGGLGAAPATSFTTPDIEASVEKGALVFRVPKHADISDGQFDAFTFDLPGDEKVTGVGFDISKTRDTDAFDLKLHRADDDRADYVHRATTGLDDDGPGQVEITTRSGPNIIRVGLFKDGTDADIANALKVSLTNVVVYGRATDDDFTTSDVVRAVCADAGVSDKYVRESGFPAMSQWWKRSTRGEILDFNGLLTGWIWLWFREGNEIVCYFGPWGRRHWLLTHPLTNLGGLIPDDPWSAATVQYKFDDGVVDGEITRIADPNPLGQRIDAPTTFEFECSRKVAGALAQRLADIGPEERWLGSLEFSWVQDTSGRWWPAASVHAGDMLFDPIRQVWHKADRLEHAPQLGRAQCTMPSGLPLYDRFKARKELH